MSGSLTAPLYFKPLLMERVWGGNRLDTLFGKSLPAGKVIGESWELCDRNNEQTLIDGGDFDGRSLRSLIAAHPHLVYGQAFSAASESLDKKIPRFPLLIKYIDAGAALSVQVHPDDRAARAKQDRGKSECWVILHAEPDAQIVRGLKPGVTRADYDRALAAGRIEDVLHSFTAKTGDIIALPPGTIHAMGAGIVVLEVQQNSDITYRVHDYNRLGLDGKPRPLHLAEAAEAIRFEKPGDEFEGDMTADTVKPHVISDDGHVRTESVLKGYFFSLDRITLRSTGELPLAASPAAPRVVMAVSGEGTLAGRAFVAGQTVLLPASLPEVLIAGTTESFTFLLSTPTAEAY